MSEWINRLSHVDDDLKREIDLLERMRNRDAAIESALQEQARNAIREEIETLRRRCRERQQFLTTGNHDTEHDGTFSGVQNANSVHEALDENHTCSTPGSSPSPSKNLSRSLTVPGSPAPPGRCLSELGNSNLSSTQDNTSHNTKDSLSGMITLYAPRAPDNQNPSLDMLEPSVRKAVQDYINENQARSYGAFLIHPITEREIIQPRRQHPICCYQFAFPGETAGLFTYYSDSREACEACISRRRFCIQTLSGVDLPYLARLPLEWRRGKKIGELSYWVRAPGHHFPIASKAGT